MLKKTASTSSATNSIYRLNSIENYSAPLFKSTQSICVQTDTIQNTSQCTNTPNYLDDMLIQGKNMNDDEFEKFIKGRASDCYWKILAERARIKLDDELRENQQLHELLDELTKENEKLQAKNEHCEYLTNVFNSMTSEYDSGIELHITDESPMSKRQKTHI
ncbi:unnamed protein product [Rotaria socialis]|uniref:Geminin n=1 Tax=Rotaria socialis TaxID=392032 RepID=A0A817UHH0_9BILA|nr:unnamed protein product [Rotaria socialis]CAF3330494.1 unnamed protein product [Rotaria socialis]CAF3435732.1 unnamed protein product [Rotaria socialis]CAF3445018.1 unnamed protein product [Rotaria socialis]CAF3477238.1 unnamed protein product [Rotaria socialis]